MGASPVTNIVSTQMDVNATLVAAGACYFYYARAQNAIYLADDAGTWQPLLTLGSPGTLQNSQCILDAGASSFSVSGINLTVNLALSFKAAFAGAKGLYMEAYNGLDSGWVPRGNWTATSGPPDFTISSPQSSQTGFAGGSVVYTVNTTAVNGFNGTETFNFSGLPSGFSGAFSPATMAGAGSTQLTLNIPQGTAPGTTGFNITGTSGSMAHSVSASAVTAALPAASARGTTSGSGVPANCSYAGPYFVLNDSLERCNGFDVFNYSSDGSFTSCPVDGNGVTSRIVAQGSSGVYIAYTASSSAATGSRTIRCIWTSHGVAYPPGVVGTLAVYDATPVVTSVERYDVPGNHLFVQGEGAVGVRILGRNFGKNPFNDTSRLTVSGAGVTVQYITGWRDDGSEIDVVFNIDLTAPGTHTVTVTSNGVSGLGFQPGGNPPSQSRGNGQFVVILVDVVVSAQKRDHDDPGNNAYTTLAPTDVLYGGSEDSTSDALTLTVGFDPVPIPVATYTWSVTGPGSENYSPPSPSASASTWSVGRIYPQAGNLIFRVDIQSIGGGVKSATRTFEVGIRSDDVILVGWINASGVPLPSSVSGFDPLLMNDLPPDGNVTSSIGCNTRILGLSLNDDSNGNGILTAADRSYILYWLFLYANNADPTNVIPGNDFRDPATQFTSESKVMDFINTPTNYKLVNRLQVKFRVSGGARFNGEPTILRGPLSRTGVTPNPCGSVLGFLGEFASQAGPANGSRTTTNSVRVAEINDGSPDSGAVRAFNTLEGLNVSNPVYWENIGSKITFSFDGGPSPQLVLQPYPVYYEFRNGRLLNIYPEAATPVANFNLNPYPSGTVSCHQTSPFDGLTRITPGGRCGDQGSPPDVSARNPIYVQP